MTNPKLPGILGVAQDAAPVVGRAREAWRKSNEDYRRDLEEYHKHLNDKYEADRKRKYEDMVRMLAAGGLDIGGETSTSPMGGTGDPEIDALLSYSDSRSAPIMSVTELSGRYDRDHNLEPHTARGDVTGFHGRLDSFEYPLVNDGESDLIRGIRASRSVSDLERASDPRLRSLPVDPTVSVRGNADNIPAKIRLEDLIGKVRMLKK